MRCPVRVHNGGNRAKPPQTGKAYRPTTADRRTVLCTRVQSSAAVVSDHSLIRDWISRRPAQDARASRDDPSSPTSATKSAKSGHYAPQQKSPYSISSSASDINDAGIVSPSAFAVVRLMMNSNFVGCSTGKSDGFEPCNILCTYVAPRRKKSRTLAL